MTHPGRHPPKLPQQGKTVTEITLGKQAMEECLLE